MIAIEVKATKDDKKYLLAEEIRQLKQFCEIFNAEPWIGVKFSRENWLFLTLDQLDEKEKSHSISLKDAKKRGFLFEELIKE